MILAKWYIELIEQTLDLTVEAEGISIRDYLTKLLLKVWQLKEGFSGKNE